MDPRPALPDSRPAPDAAFRTFADLTGDGVVVLDAERRIRFVNRAAATLLRLGDGHAAGRDGVGETFVYPFEIGVTEEVSLHGPAGEVSVVELQAREMTWGEEPATLVVLKDLAPRQAALHLGSRMERELRGAHRREMIGRLASGLAHDFNNFLTVILGRSEMLASAVADDAALSRQVQLIHMGAKQQSIATRQFLGVVGREVAAPQDVDLDATLRAILPVLDAVLGDHTEVQLSVEPSVRAARVARGLLEQAIFNLVLNARDAMPTGGRVRVRAESLVVEDDATSIPIDLEAGTYVRIEVADTGVGMPPHIHARALEPFFSTKRMKDQGGLGLAVVRGICEEAGGGVWIESEEGCGTAVSIVFPGVRALVGRAPPEAAAEPPLAPAQTAVVLVAEDEPDVLEMVRKILEHGKLETLGAADGRAALAAAQARTGPVDLLVTDVVMPGLGGHELACALQETQPELPVLYMSGYTQHDIYVRGLIPKGAPYIQKPFTPAELLAATSNLLMPTAP